MKMYHTEMMHAYLTLFEILYWSTILGRKVGLRHVEKNECLSVKECLGKWSSTDITLLITEQNE